MKPSNGQDKGKMLGVICQICCIFLFALCFRAESEQRDEARRICHLGNPISNSDLEPFRERLHQLGYSEGQNFSIETRSWAGNVERIPKLADELVRVNCDVILTTGTEAAQAAKKYIKTVPVVMAFGADAVRRGIVADLARPGGNITGLTSINTDLFGKQLELLKEVIPKLTRAAFFWSPTNPDGEHQAKEAQAAGETLHLQIQAVRNTRS